MNKDSIIIIIIIISMYLYTVKIVSLSPHT